MDLCQAAKTKMINLPHAYPKEEEKNQSNLETQTFPAKRNPIFETPNHMPAYAYSNNYN